MSKSRTYVFKVNGEGEEDVAISLVSPQVTTPDNMDDLRTIVGFCCGILFSYGENIDLKEVKKLGRILSEIGVIPKTNPN